MEPPCQEQSFVRYLAVKMDLGHFLELLLHSVIILVLHLIEDIVSPALSANVNGWQDHDRTPPFPAWQVGILVRSE